MIDWNNDGKIDGEDWMLTEMIMDEEDSGGGSSEKPNGSCLASFLLILIVPMVGVPFIGYLMM